MTMWIFASVIMSAFAILIAGFKRNIDEGIMTILFPLTIVLSTVFFLVGTFTYEEPQKIKEQAVEAGVGKFKADEKGKVSFYFIRHDGTEVKYENPRITTGDLK